MVSDLNKIVDTLSTAEVDIICFQINVVILLLLDFENTLKSLTHVLNLSKGTLFYPSKAPGMLPMRLHCTGTELLALVCRSSTNT